MTDSDSGSPARDPRSGAPRDADRLGLLDEVFRRAPTFMHVLRGPHFVFELANPAYYQLVGHRELIGRPAFEAMPEGAAGGFPERLAQVMATSEPFVGHELPVMLARTPGAAPEERLIDLVYLPLLEPDGTCERVLGHGIDVTEQALARRAAETALRVTEAQLAERTAAAEEAARLKTEFLATMSHEFRTPLNAILGYTQLLDMGVLGTVSAAQRVHLERLAASGHHLLRLVDDVLDMAKVDADRLEVRADVLTTGAVVAAALSLVQPQATAKGIRVLDLGGSGPGVPYVGDEHRVRQILVNLLSNAVKFTAPGGQITVSCGTAEAVGPGAQPGGPGASRGPKEGANPADWAYVQVEDTGRGIAPDLAASLFEPFVQADGGLTREQGGSGLGLAISRRLARLMGGDLVARSRPGVGSTFTLWLPGRGGPGTAEMRDAARVRGRTPPGVPAIPLLSPAAVQHPNAQSGADALGAAAYEVLHALGIRLAADTEPVAERYVRALRADGRFPGVRELPDVQLRDHATPFVGLLASQLMIIGETRGQAPELLGDGAELRRVMAELHGAQRHRLGWSETDIERESVLLCEQVERALRDALDTATSGAGASDAVAGGDDGGSAVRTAAQYAERVTRATLDQATRTAVRAFRFARAAATP